MSVLVPNGLKINIYLLRMEIFVDLVLDFVGFVLDFVGYLKLIDKAPIFDWIFDFTSLYCWNIFFEDCL